MTSGRRKNHKDLILWQKAISLAAAIHRLTNTMPRHEIFGLSSQIRRAAVSIPSNVAEGATRRTTREFIAFMHIARGSFAELETQLLLVREIGYLRESDLAPILFRLGDRVQHARRPERIRAREGRPWAVAIMPAAPDSVSAAPSATDAAIPTITGYSMLSRARRSVRQPVATMSPAARNDASNSGTTSIVAATIIAATRTMSVAMVVSVSSPRTAATMTSVAMTSKFTNYTTNRSPRPIP